MLNALVTLPFVLAFAVAALVLWETIALNQHKIVSALKGRSLLAEAPLATRPVKLRYVSRAGSVRAPVRRAEGLRVAA